MKILLSKISNDARNKVGIILYTLAQKTVKSTYINFIFCYFNQFHLPTFTPLCPACSPVSCLVNAAHAKLASTMRSVTRRWLIIVNQL